MDIFIIIVLLAIAAQTTYITVATTRRAKSPARGHAPVFVDTSVLIDGRIIAVAESGFVTSTLCVPRSVIGELQFLADNGDTEKRTRARHGLDIVAELQALTQVRTEIFPDSTRAEEGVDNRLLELAKKHGGSICTIDYNLNKVAQVEGIAVLNVNELAKSLRMAYLPGEKIMLELTQKGNDGHQAVGHLPDGTMVVVEHAHAGLGKTVEIEFIRSLQTAAGKMMFAKLVTPIPSKKTPAPRIAAVKQKSQGRQPAQQAQVEQKPVQEQQEAQAKPQRAQRAPRQQQPRTRQPQAEQQTQSQNQAQGQQPNQRNNRRRKTHEDSLVELANR